MPPLVSSRTWRFSVFHHLSVLIIKSLIDELEQSIARWFAAGRISVIVSVAGLLSRSLKCSDYLCLCSSIVLRVLPFLSFIGFSDFDDFLDSCLVIS